MEESILLPSPNWFLASNLAVSKDGWLIYGGPSKSLCVLEPLQPDSNLIVAENQGYRAHVVNWAHAEKIVSVDISPVWQEKRTFLSGSADGSVKQWAIEKTNRSYKLKSTHSHEIHHNEKEELVGVGYSNETFAVTVGCYGNIVKWDLNSNVVKTFHHFLKSFKPVCMSCSHHVALNVAVGTKQGVIFVIDLNGAGKVLYKVRGQDDEVIYLSWCPQYDVAVKKTLKESEKRVSLADRLEAIRKEPENKQSVLEQSVLQKSVLEQSVLEESGVIKKLPEDSFDEAVVPEDDMFDIYKDHESDEFGHKKYEPEEIRVRVKLETDTNTDYLAECLKLKNDILQKKNETEPSIESLVQELDKARVDDVNKPDVSEVSTEVAQSSSTTLSGEGEKTKEVTVEASDHMHKHLLATIGKYGGIRIWSKTGKLVGSCAVPNTSKNPRNKSPNWPTLLWYKPDVLLIADGKSQLLECNPLKIDCKNKLEWRVLHTYHKRGLYCITSDAPRVQTDTQSEHWSIWTISQERTLIRYCMESRQKLATFATCGGFIYEVQACPYDAGKIAVSVGDGAVRIWESSTLVDDESKLTPGRVHTYWQNVQGKVLSIAWHPTRENWLAFATAESRVGLIDTNSKSEKAARVLIPALSGGVYSLCWGEANHLYASAGGDLVLYHTDRPEEAPVPVKVELEGQVWQVSAVHWSPRGMLCGSNNGAVALLTTELPHTVVTAAFVFAKMIHTIEWHPLQTSSSNEESQYKNLIAVCSLDKEHTVVILEYGEKEDGVKQLSTWKSLSGHKGPVLQVAWNPHRDGVLLSTSQDATVRVWDVLTGVCTSIFGGHTQSALGGAWSARPQLGAGGAVLSGGADCTLRLWDSAQHPADQYDETKHETMTKRDKKKKDRKEPKDPTEAKKAEDEPDEVAEQLAATQDITKKGPKKFLLPTLTKQMYPCGVQGIRKMLQKHIDKTLGESEKGDGDAKELDLDYVKLFGSINEVNEVLDKEMATHLERENTESWIMLSIFRGHIDAMVQFASQRDLLCPYLLSITPCVSFKYWKDATQLYLAQIDRLVAKGESDKLFENKSYGGPVYRKVVTLLSMQDVKGAVAALVEARLFKEAYILCRTRYLDSIAEQTLKQWAQDSFYTGMFNLSAACYIALGDLPQAAAALAKSNDQESLSLAADIAKASGQTTLAQHMETKALTKQTHADTTEELLEQLPSRIELLMKEGNKVENGEAPGEDLLNKSDETELEKLAQKTELLVKEGDKVENGEAAGENQVVPDCDNIAKV